MTTSKPSKSADGATLANGVTSASETASSSWEGVDVSTSSWESAGGFGDSASSCANAGGSSSATGAGGGASSREQASANEAISANAKTINAAVRGRVISGADAGLACRAASRQRSSSRIR